MRQKQTFFLQFCICFLILVCLGTNAEGESSPTITVEVDKSGEWSTPIEVPSGLLRLERIDPECCWKSQLAIDLVDFSPPYLAVPFGRMQVGEVIELKQLWRSTLAAYRAKVEAAAGTSDENIGNDEEESRKLETRKRRNVEEPSLAKVRLSSNCPLRIAFP